MPWKECKPMDERLRFIARLLEGEKMSPLCREFGISRVTGYKIFNRYKDCGLDALNDRSRRPYRQSNKLPFQVERTILGIKKKHPSWGAPKIRDKLIRAYPMIKPPLPADLQRSVPSMPCWIVMAWLSAGNASDTRPKAPRSSRDTGIPKPDSAPTQYVCCHRQLVIAVCRHFEFALLLHLELQRLHQTTCLVTANLKTLLAQVFHHHATAQTASRSRKQLLHASPQRQFLGRVHAR